MIYCLSNLFENPRIARTKIVVFILKHPVLLLTQVGNMPVPTLMELITNLKLEVHLILFLSGILNILLQKYAIKLSTIFQVNNIFKYTVLAGIFIIAL